MLEIYRVAVELIYSRKWVKIIYNMLYYNMLKLHVELHVHICIAYVTLRIKRSSNITSISVKSQGWYDVFLVEVVFKI